jgi:hypothetical protein
VSLLLVLALAASAARTPAAEAAHADVARIELQVAKIAAFRANLTLPKDAAADATAAQALTKARDALRKARARLRLAGVPDDSIARLSRGVSRQQTAALRRGMACSLAPVRGALAGRGAEVEAFLDAFEAEWRSASFPLHGTGEVTTLTRQHASRGLQVIVDGLVAERRSDGSLLLSLLHSVGTGEAGGETAGDQTVVVFDASGRVRDVEAAEAVQACLDGAASALPR